MGYKSKRLRNKASAAPKPLPFLYTLYGPQIAPYVPGAAMIKPTLGPHQGKREMARRVRQSQKG